MFAIYTHAADETNRANFFARGFLDAREKLNGYRGANGRLRVKQKLLESRGVVLSVGLCLES